MTKIKKKTFIPPAIGEPVFGLFCTHANEKGGVERNKTYLPNKSHVTQLYLSDGRLPKVKVSSGDVFRVKRLNGKLHAVS